MEIFGKRKYLKMIAAILLFLTLFNFIVPRTVYAGLIDGLTNLLNKLVFGLVKFMVGGILKLFVFLFDGIIVLINNLFCTDNNEACGILHFSADEAHMDASTLKKINLTPANIIMGKFVLLNANIFHEYNAKDAVDGGYYDIDVHENDLMDNKNKLRTTVAEWYYILRNLAIVALLSVLVYVAIRMVISSVSSDKAKYKTMLKDWAVALCLVFFLHFIMLALLEISTLITDAINPGSAGYDINNVREQILESVIKLEETTYEKDKDLFTSLGTIFEPVGDGLKYLFLEIAMSVFSIMFCIKYLMRSITIMFLTIIAPVTAITYPIDKIKDSKAQAYNYWFREYLYNSIIQPFHLILFVVLIGAAGALAEDNFIYCLVCLAAIFPSEKIIQQMFGIKNSTGGALSDIAKASAITKGMNALSGKIGSDKGKVDKKDDDSDDGNELPPKQKNNSIGEYDDGSKPSSERSLPAGGSEGGGSDSSSEPSGGGSDSSSEPSGGGSDSSSEPSGGDSDSLENSNENNGKNDTGEYTEDGVFDNGNIPDASSYLPSREVDETAQNNTENGETTEEDKTENGETTEGDKTENGEQYKEAGLGTRVKARANKSVRALKNGKDKAINAVKQAPGKAWSATKAAPGKAWRAVKAAPGKAWNTAKEKLTSPEMQQAKRAIRNSIAKDVRKKFGTTSGKKLAGKAFKKIGGTATRMLAKGTGIALGAGLGAALTIATGDVGGIMAGISAGAGLGSRLSGRVDRGIKSATGTVGKYLKAGRKAYGGIDYQNEKRKKSYMQNQSQIDYVTKRLADKNGGNIPSRQEVREEMEKRWEYKENGIKDEKIIDGALDLAEEKRKEKIKSIGGDVQKVEDAINDDSEYAKDYKKLMKDMKKLPTNASDAEKQALEDKKAEFDNKYKRKYGGVKAAVKHYNAEQEANKQSMIAANVANDIPKNDFRDSKKMTGLRTSMANEYSQQSGKDVKHSEKVATKVIEDAAKIRGVKSPNFS